MKALSFAAMLLVLILAGGTHADVPEEKPVAVPFQLLQTKHMAVMIKINGKGPYRVLFDTGAPVTLLNTRVAKESGLLAKDAPKPLFSLMAAGQATIQTLEVGNLKAEGVPAIIMDHPTVELAARFLGPIEGIVGFPFFARYRMTLDYQARQLTFLANGYDPPDVMDALITSLLAMTREKQAGPKVLAPAALWGFVLEKETTDQEAGVTLKQVFPASAAARAGLQVGDRLLTLDGRWTDTIADCYRAAAAVKPGTSVKVVIKRQGREMERTVNPVSGL